MAAPRDFPPPDISNCQRSHVVVVLDDVIDRVEALLIPSERAAIEFGNVLKKAIYGTVSLGYVLQTESGDTFMRTGDLVAIKSYEKAVYTARRHAENPIAEISAMQFLAHPGHRNVIQQLYCAQDREFLYSVMPFCNGGEVFDSVPQGVGLSEVDAKRYFSEMISSVNYAHQMGVCHRDISLENFIFHDDRVLLIDLGMCLRFPTDDDGVDVDMGQQGRVGKKMYMAPEVLSLSNVLIPTKADVWSLGVVLFCMLTGVPPMDVAHATDQRFVYITRGRMQALLTQWGYGRISPAAVDLMRRMLTLNYNDRISVAEIAQHAWLNDV